MAEDPLGIPELREVLYRLHEQSRRPDESPLGPDEITAIANHLYQGTSDGTRMTNPGYWSHLARIRDPNTQDLDPISAQVRQKQWQGWTGPGWSPEERAALGRDPDGFELSPGDRTSHQWSRDSHYLNDMLGRHSQKPFAHTEQSAAWGAPTKSDEEQRNKVIQDALDWYKKGENATHSVARGMTGTSNFKQYGEIEGALNAADNPDYGFGSMNTNFSAPLGYAMQRQTMRDPSAPEAKWLTDLRTSKAFTPLAAIPAVHDFFKNAIRSDAQSTVPDAIEVSRGSQFNRHSPNLPSAMSPEDRIRFITKMRGAYQQARNMNFDDYHYAKTGQLPSKAGSMAATFAADMEDPSIMISGAAGKAIGTAMGKNVSSFAEIASEMGEEILPGFALAGLDATMPLNQDPRIKPVSPGNFFTPGREARTDLHHEEHNDRMQRIHQDDTARTQAIETLRKGNKSIPPPANKPAWNMNSGFKT